ncbi:hypothetical protein [Winogradskyella sediminis]|uniref:Uncharacterized protein n=1 Tax=Winogradskyella sediminis TaxID=1382466 RepID=A0A1H1RDB0_9FLAO|nr:hypothetical protein [Winogradskyella sediminis]REG89556.1 hypothetical protein C8N41_101798 [Winogradskyella sediminis]SDS33546.1 hypothetical protein SAMN04489797_1378 [Winogradskyella sediminis]
MASFTDTNYMYIFNHYKKKYGKKSINIALLYVCLLEFSFILAIGSFLKAFASQMKMSVLSNSKFWVLYTIIALFIISKNWMRYNGRKRNILNAKNKHKKSSIFLLWILPLGCIAIALILLQVP